MGGSSPPSACSCCSASSGRPSCCCAGGPGRRAAACQGTAGKSEHTGEHVHKDGFKWLIVSIKESFHLEQLVGPGPLIIGTAEARGDKGVHSTGLE